MKWNETLVGKTILEKKYFHDGEDFNAFLDRVSGIYSEDIRADIREALKNGDLIPAGRTLYGAGDKGKRNVTLSNCFVCSTPTDDLESIYEVNKEAAIIGARGGGIGVDISNLRPKNAPVNNSARVSTGACSFMDLFNVTGGLIGQNNRHMAEMIALSCEHPDIEEFLNVKKSGNKLESANISIKFTDDFMKAVESKEDFTLHFATKNGRIEKIIDAYKFFRDFCETQYDYGDPGSIYIDRVRNYNLLSGYPEYKIDVSNPCAEYFGNAGNSCLLESINLYHCVDNPFTDGSAVDYEKLRRLVRLGVRQLNETMDYGYEMLPLDMNRRCVDDWRAIGLGVFGLADMYVALGVTYGSNQAIAILKDVMRTIFVTAVDESCRLAERDGAFGKFDIEKTRKSPMFVMLPLELQEKIKTFGLRNGQLLSIAPTGSIATMMGCSGGVEPMFAVSYERTTHSSENKGQHFRFFSKGVEDLLNYHGLSLEIPDEEIKKRFPFVVTSYDIKPLNRVRMQATMQVFVDNAISSTVNLPHSATVDDIEKIYMEAWKQGLKGITIFRDGCKRASILGVSAKKTPEDILDSVDIPKRSHIEKVNGITVTKHTACIKNMYNTINFVKGKPMEILTSHVGGCQSNIATIGRLASALLKTGVKVSQVAKELKEVPCQGCLQKRHDGNKKLSTSCGGAIGDSLVEAYNEFKNPSESDHLKDRIEVHEDAYMICPECGERKLRALGKCVQCDACGYSKCD